MRLQYERLWLKGQRSTLTFETYLLGLSYQVRIMTGFNRIQKINFSKISHLNASGSEFEVGQGQLRIII